MKLRRSLRQTRELVRLLSLLAVERVETGVVFNPILGSARQDPYPLYRRLREADPIHRSRAIRGWILFRHADCLEVLRDARFSADDRNYVAYARERAAAIQDGLADPTQPDEPVMLRRDPPDHTRLRALVNKAFTPRAVDTLRPRIAALADALLDQLATRREVDIIADYAVPLPVTIIAEMLGVPAEDRHLFKRWSDHLVGFLDPQASPGPEILRATADEFFAYMDRMASLRRAAPRDDLLSALVLAEEQGQHLSQQELHGTLALLLAAGNETTTNLIGNGLVALLRHPDQWERLRAEPALIGSAVEELLRWDSPVQFTARMPTVDLDFHGRRFRKGEAVIAVLGSANRDPAVFENPERLDIARADNRHVSFGHGVHFCLGAQLARLEGRIALGRLVERFPHLRLAADELKWRRLTFLRGLEALPVRV
jgi:pimeloyl-[acyl-carrier protein] synthase